MGIGIGLALSVSIGTTQPGGESPPEVPDAMFALGELGAWYDPSDLSTLFQDSAMTTPVAVDGDPVGAMMDKSGNSMHVLQATSGARPTYKTAGGLHWLEFTSATDLMASSATSTLNTSASDFYVGAALGAGNSGSVFLLAAPGGNPKVGLLGGGGNSKRGIFYDDFGDNREWGGDTANPQYYSDVVGVASAVGTINTELDGVAGTQLFNGGPTSFSSSTLHVEFSTLGTSDITFYGGIIVVRTMSAQDRIDMRTFFSAKAGL